MNWNSGYNYWVNQQLISIEAEILWYFMDSWVPVDFYITMVAGSVILTLSVEVTRLACPGDVVTFTCTVIQGTTLTWISEPFITENDPLTFVNSSCLPVLPSPRCRIYVVDLSGHSIALALQACS